MRTFYFVLYATVENHMSFTKKIFNFIAAVYCAVG